MEKVTKRRNFTKACVSHTNVNVTVVNLIRATTDYLDKLKEVDLETIHAIYMLDDAVERATRLYMSQVKK